MKIELDLGTQSTRSDRRNGLGSPKHTMPRSPRRSVSPSKTSLFQQPASHRQCPPKVLEQPQDVVAGDGWLPFRMYYGPELISDTLAKWANRHRVELLFIQPGKPMQNGYIERFNRTYRTEVLNAYVFETLGEVRRMTADWLIGYNERRPHESLGDLSPRQYLMAISTQPSTSARS